MILVDDGHNHAGGGDLMMAAEFATPERLAFFVRHTSGFVCAAVTNDRADRLRLPLMVPLRSDGLRVAFTVTVDAVEGTTTGISAADRAATIRALVDPATQPSDLARPGHVHVLRACDGGVLERPRQTEATVDLTRLAGLLPAGVLSEIVTADGAGMAGPSELDQLAREHGMVRVSVADIIAHRLRTERVVRHTASSRLRTTWGELTCEHFDSTIDGSSHLAMVLGDPGDEGLVRLHRRCPTGDVFGGCPCGDDLRAAMDRIAAEGAGVLLYLQAWTGGRPGLHQEVDDLDVADAAQMLRGLGIGHVRLMADGPTGLGAHHLEVVEESAWRNEPLTGTTRRRNRRGVA